MEVEVEVGVAVEVVVAVLFGSLSSYHFDVSGQYELKT